MKNKVKKIMIGIVGFFGLIKSNIVKATGDFTQTYYGIKKVPNYSAIIFFSTLIVIPITLIIGLIIYLKKKEETKLGRIIIKVTIVLLAVLIVYSIIKILTNF